ncbi:MAG: hypothetical protein WDM77_08870 [Steroidobacteraceae bacterium]
MKRLAAPNPRGIAIQQFVQLAKRCSLSVYPRPHAIACPSLEAHDGTETCQFEFSSTNCREVLDVSWQWLEDFSRHRPRIEASIVGCLERIAIVERSLRGPAQH